MVTRRNLHLFCLQRESWLTWILVNTASLTTSLLLVGIIAKNSGRNSQYYGQIFPNILDFVVVSIILGIGQWLVLSNKISGVHKGWILTNMIGFSMSAVLSFAFQTMFMLRGLNDPASSALYDAIDNIKSGLMGGLTGGTIIGFAQCLIWQDWWIWIPANTIAWAIAWAIALATVYVINRLTYVSLNIQLDLPLEWSILGLILGLVSSVITGGVLVWLLQRSNLRR